MNPGRYSILLAAPILAVGLLGWTGCSGSPEPREKISYPELVNQLADQDAIARLDAPRTELASSYDRSGGNDDHSFFPGTGPDGWNVIVDLKGPGYVSRLWTTGVLIEDKLRFYFDNEKTPRLEGSLIDLLDGNDPFQLPVAGRENLCFWSYLPLPYAKRLVITAQPSPGKKHYYQVNYQPLGKTATVDSFSLPLDEPSRQALQRLVKVWTDQDFERPPGLEIVTQSFELAPGESQAWELPAGPAMIRELKVKRVDAVSVESALNAVRLQILWDADMGTPQIDVPLGSFFGQMWYALAFQSLYVGGDDEWLYQRLPMPYRKTPVVRLTHRGEKPISVTLEASIEKQAMQPENLGILHAEWAHTGPEDVGVPHTVLRTEGPGRLAGCLLGAANQDNSWWVLESDESIRRDEETTPGWLGTGLEDYFTAGWYYARAVCRPMHGLTFKVPFRTIQYRFHGPDPVTFDSALDMEFEYGPENQSRGALDSVAFYYLAEPSACEASDMNGDVPPLPLNAHLVQGIMPELRERERHSDYTGASAFLDAFLAGQTNLADRESLQLRQLAYREKREGFVAVRADYQTFLDSTPSARAKHQAKDLLWFHESPTNALMMVYSRGDARVYVGDSIFDVPGNPADVTVIRVTVQPGQNVLAAEVAWQDHPKWYQCSLRTHHGHYISDRDWKWHTQPTGNWRSPEYDDSAWFPILGVGTKGPPDLPFFAIRPHPYLHLHGEPYGLWVDVAKWPEDKTARAVLRTVIDVPAAQPTE